MSFELMNDNQAAVILGSGSGGSWRTRHLRIRANCLSEAVSLGEVSLSHRPGAVLWADALTKCVPTLILDRFCRGVNLCDVGEGVILKRCAVPVSTGSKGAMKGPLLAMALGAALLPGVGATGSTDETLRSDEGSGWDVGSILLVCGTLALAHVVKELGLGFWQRVAGSEPKLKVSLLSPEAVLPCRSSEDAAGLDVSSVVSFVLQPGESRLVPTGVAIQCPPGTYGRLASRSSLAARNIHVGGGVVDPDYRGELRVILRNAGTEPAVFETGHRIAQLIMEKFEKVKPCQVESLPTSGRGIGGFGSTGIGLKGLGVPSDPVAGELEGESAGSTIHVEAPLSSEGGDRGGSPIESMYFDEVFLAPHTEGMQNFLRRIRSTALSDRPWLVPDQVIDLVTDRPVSGSSRTFVVKADQALLRITVLRHGTWRRKLVDVHDPAPRQDDPLTHGTVTIAWLENDMIMLRCDNRRGVHRMPFLKDRWTGFTLLFERYH